MSWLLVMVFSILWKCKKDIEVLGIQYNFVGVMVLGVFNTLKKVLAHTLEKMFEECKCGQFIFMF